MARVLLFLFATLLVVLGSLASATRAQAAAGALSVTFPDQFPVEGQNVGQPVATFTDAITPGAASAYTATITWGDGTTSTGTVVSTGAGAFAVDANHIYPDELNSTGSISITETDGDSGSAQDSVSVQEGDNGSLTGRALTIGVNTAYQGPVASFNDVYLAQVASDFSATINWGDGVQTVGTVTGGNGNFLINGAHTYTATGTYNITTLFTDDSPSGITNVPVPGTATVVVPFTMTANSVSTTEGTAFGGTVATFTDNMGGDPASNYSATVNWGDGSASAGTVTSTGGSNYSISGSHTYADEGSFTTSVSLTDSDGTSASAGASATVADADSFTGTGTTLTLPPATSATVTVATYSDTYAGEPASALTANIAWGDGTSSAGTVTGGNGSFSVSGTHSYASLGNYTVTVSLGESSLTTRTTATTTVHVVQPVTIAVNSLSATEGTAWNGTLATFTDNLGADPVSNYSASVNWGDGTTAAATVTSNGSNGYSISGTHTYTDEGSFPVTVSMQDSDGYSASGSSTAAVADADTFSGTGSTVNVAAGQAFNGTVASFTDTYTGQTAGNLSATINWGDGTSTSGTVSGGAGSFTVSSSHTYAAVGTDTTSVTISETGGADATTVTGTAHVSPALSLTANGVSTTEGTAFSGTVATGTDAAGAGAASAYTATITWGDGTTSSGTVASSGTSITVSGSHTYTQEGSFSLGVTLTESDGDSASGSASAAVADADHFTGAPTTLALTAGQAFSGSVGSFADSYTATASSELTASVSWGDGSSGAGTVSGSAGAFTVSGSHTYTTAGSYNVLVTIGETPPGTATGSLTSTANVASAGGGGSDSFKPVYGFKMVHLGHALTGAVGHFRDTNASAPVAQMTASINWGDGSSSAGSVSREGTGTRLVVSGTHTYAKAGVYVAVTTITYQGVTATTKTLVIVFGGDAGGDGDGHGDGHGQGHNDGGSGGNGGSDHPSSTPPASPTPAPAPTSGSTPASTPSAAPSSTPASTPDSTSTPAPSSTPVATAAPTPNPTSTPAPSATPKPAATATPTPSASPAPTPCSSGDRASSGHGSTGGDCGNH